LLRSYGLHTMELHILTLCAFALGVVLTVVASLFVSEWRTWPGRLYGPGLSAPTRAAGPAPAAAQHFTPVPTVLGKDGKHRTTRGFRVYGQFWCRYQTSIRVQESSAAFESCVWLFLRGRNGGEADAHLGLEGAKLLLDALQEFIEDVEQGRTSAEVELARAAGGPPQTGDS
jgi:hypothetical protein